MDTQFFNELVGSIVEAGAIKRQEKAASRILQVERPDVKLVREKTGLSQTEFANRLDISPKDY